MDCLNLVAADSFGQPYNGGKYQMWMTFLTTVGVNMGATALPVFPSVA